MSRALAIAIAILTSLHSYVSAQSAPSCLSGYDWSFNSLKQSPCTMTVALGGACVKGQFSLAPLEPGYVYLGPTQLIANSCRCSSVYYSLLSACANCQNQSYLDWSVYKVNCSTAYDQTFLEPIPSSIVVPHYAYLDVKIRDTFDVVAAQNAGGPESSPVPQPTGTSRTPGTTSTATSVATPIKTPSKKVNIGAIVGGVVGGIVVIGIIAGLIAFMIIRRRKNSASNSSTYNPYASPQTMMSDTDTKYNSTPVPIMTSGKLYDPNDPTTFPPGYNNGHPNDADPVGYSPYPGSPQRVTSTITGGSAPVPSRTTHYTGAPEL